MIDVIISEWIKIQPIPPPEEQIRAINDIISSGPNILLFKHWYWLTSKPVPHRHNFQTNEEYARRHYWKLRKAAIEWNQKNLDKTSVV